MPYTVYTLFNASNELIYAGRAEMWMRRLEDHAYTAPWFKDVVSAKFQHVETKAEADALEWKVITEGKPLYNRNQRTPCSRCGGPRRSGTSSLCWRCQPLSHGPRRTEPTVTCPRCGGVKPSGPAYCPPCKREVSRLARKTQKERNRS